MRGRWMIAGIAGVLVVVIVGYVALRWSPAVPASAASTPVAHAVLSGESGSGCAPRIDNSSGYMDVCWDARRLSATDGDPSKDYFLLHVFGTFGRGSAYGSPRWGVLKAALEGQPADGVFDAWPTGEFDGTCEPEPVRLMPLDTETLDTLCGHITTSDQGGWAHAVTWTCQGCLIPGAQDRSLSLYESVAVPEGSTPSWQVYADFGD